MSLEYWWFWVATRATSSTARISSSSLAMYAFAASLWSGGHACDRRSLYVSRRLLCRYASSPARFQPEACV